jgi:hypothetical protein
MKNYRLYNEDDVQKAIHEIKYNKLSRKAAAVKYNIPRTTLGDKLGRRHMKKVGKPPLLEQSKEKPIVDAINHLTEWGFMLANHEVRFIIGSYFIENGLNVKPDGSVSYEWLQSFMNRWKCRLILKNETTTSFLFFKSILTEHQISHYFINGIDRIYNKFNLFTKPDNIWTFEEYGLMNSTNSQRILYNRKYLRINSAINTKMNQTDIDLDLNKNNNSDCESDGGDDDDDDNNSTLYHYYCSGSCFNASGHYLETFINYKMNPQGTNEWMDGELFYLWLSRIFIPKICHLNGQKILFMRGHVSYITVKAINLAASYSIIIYSFPVQNSTSLQPFNVGILEKLRDNYEICFREYLEKEMTTKLTNNNFKTEPAYYPQNYNQLYLNKVKQFKTKKKKIDKKSFENILLEKLNIKVFTQDNARNGFFNSGLFPLNKEKIHQNIIDCNQDLFPDSVRNWPLRIESLRKDLNESRENLTYKNDDNFDEEKCINSNGKFLNSFSML